MSHRGIFVAAALLLAAIAPSAAHELKVGTLEITDLWARATPPNAPTGGGYMSIANKGDQPDTLVSVSSPQAEATELHEMKVADGVMTMKPVAGGIEIPAGGSVSLAPGGFHIMFLKPKAPFVEGAKLPVTLTFAKAGKVDTFLHILAIGAPGPKGDAGHDMGNMGTMQ